MLWFDVPEEYRSWVTPRADPFLIAHIFPLMLEGENVHVHGDISASLLEPLLGYMDIWRSWRPGRCHSFTISVDSELEDYVPATSDTVLLFSGGLDAQTTLQRHIRGDAGARSRRIGACVYARGFMNGLDDSPRYRSALKNAQESVAEFAGRETPVIPIVSNWEESNHDTMPDSIGGGLIAFLHLFKAQFSRGMLSSSVSIKGGGTYGSHPFSDPLLGHGNFEIECDDVTSSRPEKALYLSDKPEVLDRLLICHDFDDRARNCGKCEKCFRTALCFLVEGKPVPDSIRIDWQACKEQGLLYRVFWSAPESCEYMFKKIRAEGLRHPELIRFRNRYQFYITKRRLDDLLMTLRFKSNP